MAGRYGSSGRVIKVRCGFEDPPPFLMAAPKARERGAAAEGGGERACPLTGGSSSSREAADRGAARPRELRRLNTTVGVFGQRGGAPPS